jgi:hypothetical protein
VLAMLLLAGDGCKEAAAPPASGDQASSPAATQAAPGKTAAATNRVDAWINVSSGCQQATVDLLKQLATQYAGKIDVSVTDFGTPEGADKWRLAGLHCMTIQFNGKNAVTFPVEGDNKTVVFQMPPGLLWEHPDLKAAFKALDAGTLREASDEEVQQLTQPVKVDLHPRAEGAKFFLGQRLIATLEGKEGGLSPAARASAATKAVEKWTAGPISPSDVTPAKGPDGWGVYGGEVHILSPTSDDALDLGPAATTEAVARMWASNLQKAVFAALTEAHKTKHAAAK